MVQGGGSELAVQLAEVRATLDMVEKEKQRLEVLKRRQEKEIQQVYVLII
jgi:hypothetical protein